MSFDKSKDHLYQVSPVSVLYLPKTVEGDTTFNTTSLGVFASAAKQVDYVVEESSQRDGVDSMQHERRVFHVFRTPWQLVFPAVPEPKLSDKLYFAGRFYIVEDVMYGDRDDFFPANRWRLTTYASPRKVTA